VYCSAAWSRWCSRFQASDKIQSPKALCSLWLFLSKPVTIRSSVEGLTINVWLWKVFFKVMISIIGTQDLVMDLVQTHYYTVTHQSASSKTREAQKKPLVLLIEREKDSTLSRATPHPSSHPPLPLFPYPKHSLTVSDSRILDISKFPEDSRAW